MSQDAPPSPLRVVLVDLWGDAGTRNYTAPLADALAARSDISLILYLNTQTVRSLYAGALSRCSARFFCAPTGYRPISRLLLQPFEIIRLFLCLRRDRPDIVHCSFMHPWLTLLLPLLRSRFAPAITWHDVTVHEGERFLRKRLALRALIRYGRVLFVHSEKNRREAAARMGESAERLVVVPHGTYDHWRPLRRDNAPPENATFLFFGRILPYKAPDVLFRAFAILLKNHPEARLIVAGSGDLDPYAGEMEPITANLEIHNRPIPEKEAVELFQRSIALVVCHREVSQSGLLFAAASMETPVIATRVGALEETVRDGETGLLIPPEDAAALAEAMGWMIDHPEERSRMGPNAYRHVSATHGPKIVAEKTVQGYRQALFCEEDNR